MAQSRAPEPTLEELLAIKAEREKLKTLPGLLEVKAKKESEFQAKNRILRFYPKDGPLSRANYPKHMEFFAASKEHSEICFMAANRSGKTIAGCYAVAMHLTGDYPEWWPGRRFEHATDWWAAGDTSQTTRDILQFELMGRMTREFGEKADQAIGIGTGMIPASRIKNWTPKSGIPNGVEQVWVHHKSGGISTLGFKSYDQRRESFQGTSKHGVLFDEEPDISIYSEGLVRTLTTNGIVLLTFTPLLGISEVVKRFLPDMIA